MYVCMYVLSSVWTLHVKQKTIGRQGGEGGVQPGLWTPLWVHLQLDLTKAMLKENNGLTYCLCV